MATDLDWLKPLLEQMDDDPSAQYTFGGSQSGITTPSFGGGLTPTNQPSLNIGTMAPNVGPPAGAFQGAPQSGERLQGFGSLARNEQRGQSWETLGLVPSAVLNQRAIDAQKEAWDLYISQQAEANRAMLQQQANADLAMMQSQAAWNAQMQKALQALQSAQQPTYGMDLAQLQAILSMGLGNLQQIGLNGIPMPQQQIPQVPQLPQMPQPPAQSIPPRPVAPVIPPVVAGGNRGTPVFNGATYGWPKVYDVGNSILGRGGPNDPIEFRIYRQNQDPIGGLGTSRAMLSTGTSFPRRNGDGRETYYSSMKMPSNFPMDATKGWTVLYQWHTTNDSGAGQPIEFGTVTSGGLNNMYIIVGGGTIGGAGYHNLGPIPRDDKFHDYAFDINWANNSNGSVTVYQDGRSLGTFRGPTVMPGDAGSLLMQGIYRAGGSKPTSVWQTPMMGYRGGYAGAGASTGGVNDPAYQAALAKYNADLAAWNAQYGGTGAGAGGVMPSPGATSKPYGQLYSTTLFKSGTPVYFNGNGYIWKASDGRTVYGTYAQLQQALQGTLDLRTLPQWTGQPLPTSNPNFPPSGAPVGGNGSVMPSTGIPAGTLAGLKPGISGLAAIGSPQLRTQGFTFGSVVPLNLAYATSGYGASRDGGSRPHAGLDIDVPMGTPVYAAASGVVNEVDNEGRIGILHPDIRDERGIYRTRYIHLSRQVVRPGDRVTAGQLIGYSGDTLANHPHLHFEVRAGGSTGPSGYAIPSVWGTSSNMYSLLPLSRIQPDVWQYVNNYRNGVFTGTG